MADNELTVAEIEKIIDEEKGSQFDWLDFPGFLELNKTDVLEFPDRSWVADIECMLKSDGQADGIFQALTMPLRQANLTIEKPDEDSGGKITESVHDLLFRPATEGGLSVPFETTFGQMANASAVRRTYHELVWGRTPDDRLGFSKIAHRPSASCEIVRDRKSGDHKGFKQFVDWDAGLRQRAGVDWMGFIEIPQNRAVIHINNQHRDPMFGWSDLEVTHWAWCMKKQVLQLWFTLLRRSAEPWVLAYGKSGPEAKKNARQIAGLKSGGVAAVSRPGNPEERMYDVLDTGSESAAALFQAMVSYLDGMMSASVMAGFLDLAGANNNPARASTALSSDQSGLFLQSRRGAAKELEGTVNLQIIWPFVRVNFGPNAPVPRLKVEKIAADQVEKAMAMLGQLGSAQNMNVPAGFIDMLIERVAAYLDLDDKKVRKLIAERAKLARQQQAQQGMAQTNPESPEGNLQDQVQGALSAVGTPPPGTGPAAPPPEEPAA